MNRGRLLLVVALLVGGLPLGCAASAKAPVTAAAESEPPGFSPDQDVPLLAPDEQSGPANSRLTATRTIGGGPNDTSVDGRHRGTTSSAATKAPSTLGPSTVYPRSRGYGRGYSRGGVPAYTTGYGAVPTNTAAYGTTTSAPAVGGNYPTIPSYGGAVAK